MLAAILNVLKFVQIWCDKTFNFKVCFGIYIKYTRNRLELVDKYWSRRWHAPFSEKNLVFRRPFCLCKLLNNAQDLCRVSNRIFNHRHLYQHNPSRKNYRPYCPSGCRTIITILQGHPTENENIVTTDDTLLYITLWNPLSGEWNETLSLTLYPPVPIIIVFNFQLPHWINMSFWKYDKAWHQSTIAQILDLYFIKSE